MAESERGFSQEEFYAKVRKRTAENWRKKYLTSSEEDEKAEKILARIRSKPESPYSISNVIWLLTSIGVFYLTDFAAVILYDKRVSRNWLYGGAACLAIAVICAIYCIVWLSWYKKINSDNWETYNPFVIPIATICMITGTILICTSLWPVWNILTFPIVGTQIMGLVVMIVLIPDIF